jgi:putative methanogen marker protein 4
MVLLETFLEKSKDKNIKIGIGIGKSQTQYQKIINGITRYLRYNKAEIYLFGYHFNEKNVSNKKINTKSELTLNFVSSENPEKKIIRFLKTHKLNGVIRGGLSSHEFLIAIKNVFSITHFNRLALLETVSGQQFFFGPVGIDECNDSQSKILFIKQCLNLLKTIGIKPVISVLSGGRKGDLGRCSLVDQSIKEAEHVVNHFKELNLDLEINHNEILIEDAIANGSNLILAPNGISGNLIYRTLVHLGGGRAYGAIYLGLDSIIIDTSRVGDSSEIEGALIMASALYP